MVGSSFDTCTDTTLSLQRVELRNVGHTAGALQRVDVKQSRATPLLLSAWSRVVPDEGGVASVSTQLSDYSIYADITYVDGTHLWAYSIPFDPMHTTADDDGWQQGYGVLPAPKAIEAVVLVCMYRWQIGTVLFDDVCLSNLETGICTLQV